MMEFRSVGIVLQNGMVLRCAYRSHEVATSVAHEVATCPQDTLIRVFSGIPGQPDAGDEVNVGYFQRSAVLAVLVETAMMEESQVPPGRIEVM